GKEELKKEFVHIISISEVPDYVPDINRFSSWLRLIRTTAWVRRFIFNCQHDTPRIGELNGDEIEDAQMIWWKIVQHEQFGTEMACVRKSQVVPQSSVIRNLELKIDENDHRYTKLLLLYLHNRNAHQGMETVLNTVRENHWIVRGRSAVRKTFRDCQWCKIQKVKPRSPIMGA
ncbi:unnamed protein product, partial [Allacma fusca]